MLWRIDGLGRHLIQQFVTSTVCYQRCPLWWIQLASLLDYLGLPKLKSYHRAHVVDTCTIRDSSSSSASQFLHRPHTRSANTISISSSVFPNPENSPSSYSPSSANEWNIPTITFFFVVDEKAAGSRPTKAGRDKDSQEKKAAKKKAKKAKEIEKTKDEGTSYPSLDRYVRSKNLVPATAYFSIDLGLGSFHFVFVSNWRRNRTECGTRLFSLYEHYSLSLSLSCLHRFFERVRKTEDPG